MKSSIIIDKTEVEAENGLVTAMHPLAAEAGIEILQQGGNAADAAVAAAFASGVVEPFMSGLGAAAYVMVYDAAAEQTLTFDGSVVVPRGAREDMFELLEPDSKGSGAYGWRATKGDAAETGYRSVLVPGAVAAYAEVLARCGTLTLGDVMAPAIRLASEGFVPDWYVFGNCAAAMQRLKPFSEITFIFYRPDGTPIPLPVSHDTSIAPDAERLVQTDLAHTMRLIAAGGRDVFYRGEIGRALAQHVSAHGGIVTEQDMAEYEVRVREPMIVPYRDKRVEFIPVNSGGPTVAEMLNILEGFDLGALGHNTPQTLHLMAEAQRMAFADRFAFLGDPAFSPIPLEGLLSKAYAAERRRHIDPDHGPVPQPVGNPWDYQAGGRPPSVPPASGGDFADQHTTHLSVIDRSRNMVSLTASLGQRFGSGVVVPGTGVILNNGMMWFDPEPGRINSIVPGKHALHAGTPALVFDDKGPQMALGAPGGRMVLTSVLQVMLNVLDFGLGMQAAITAPRIHCETGSLWVDPRLPAEVIEGLRRIRDDVVLRAETRLVSSYYGRPNGISIDRVEGVLRGGVEPFKVSTAVGF